MAPDSINSWFDLEKKFHEHFFSGSNELKLSDLTSVKQQHDGSIVDYFIRFRDTKFNVFITEKDLADLAYNGLRSDYKEKLETLDFFSVN